MEVVLLFPSKTLSLAHHIHTGIADPEKKRGIIISRY